MRFKRLLMAASAALLCLLSANAQSAQKTYELTLTLNDSTTIGYLIKGIGQPSVKFTDGRMTVNGDGYEFSNIASFCIVAKDATGIKTVKELMTANQPADIYTISGKLIAKGVKDINAAELPAGTYIIHAGGSSVKFIKK